MALGDPNPNPNRHFIAFHRLKTLAFKYTIFQSSPLRGRAIRFDNISHAKNLLGISSYEAKLMPSLADGKVKRLPLLHGIASIQRIQTSVTFWQSESREPWRANHWLCAAKHAGQKSVFKECLSTIALCEIYKIAENILETCLIFEITVPSHCHRVGRINIYGAPLACFRPAWWHQSVLSSPSWVVALRMMCAFNPR